MTFDVETSNKTHYDEVHVVCKKKDKALYIKYYLSDRERRELIEECGDGACMLFEYYLRIASLTKHEPENYSDEAASEYFGWNKQKTQRNRLKLVKAKWFDSAHFKFYNNRKGVSFYVGQEAVPQ